MLPRYGSGQPLYRHTLVLVAPLRDMAGKEERSTGRIGPAGWTLHGALALGVLEQFLQYV